MLQHVFYTAVFLHLTNSILEKHHNAHEEAIFADVIKNISRVNNVLQELITNYEQLQKIYKSQEKSDDYSSDTEIDEVFKSMHKGKEGPNKKATLKPTDKPMGGDSFPATQMIWSDDKDDDVDYSDEKMTKDDKIGKLDTLPKPEGLQAKVDEGKDDTFEITSSESMEIIRNTSVAKQNPAEIVFIDTHKKLEAIANKNVSPFNIESATKKVKTRYNKVSKNQKPNMKFGKMKTNIVNRSNDTKNIKKIVYAEAFSPKRIWKDIIKNKPVKLKPQNEITYDMPQKRADNIPKKSLRSNAANTALITVTKNNSSGIKSNVKDIFESPEDDTIAKEMFKTNVLRHAYGDACMKVVIKKCYKACRQAGKQYCSVYKCKTVFKSKFKELSKTGCIKEFEDSKSNKTVQYRGKDDAFNDATRGRFLDAVCLPHVEPKFKPHILRNRTTPLKTAPLTHHEKTINILRDKYEKACKKISAKKCISACHFASNKTCDSFKCDKTKRKKFRSYCKQECNIFYNVNDDSDSSSSESSDSSSSDTSTSGKSV